MPMIQDLTIQENTKTITQLKVIQKNGLLIEKDGLPPSLLQQISQLGIFKNPNYFKAKAKRFSTHNIPSEINCTDDEQGFLVLPRGCLEELGNLMKLHSIQLEIEDQSFKGNIFTVNFCGELKPQQSEAVESLFSYPIGILSASTGFGKTVIAAALIAKRKTNTLILVHRKPLIDQWKKSLSQFLSIDEEQIGQIGGGKQKPSGLIDIATIQSLIRNGKVKEDLVKNYGQVIVDECHHISAYSFEKVLKKTDAHFVCGLTATPTRKDGLQPIMHMQLGPIRYNVKAKNQAKVRPFDHILIPRYTKFKSNNNKATIQELYSELVKSTSRNKLIFDDVLKELDNGYVPLILTERVEHVRELAKLFKGFAKNIIVLKGGMKKSEERDRIKQLESLGHNEERLIIATGKYIGEGFDHARLDALFLTMPLSWKGTLEQYVGRLHRLHDDKTKVKVYDYVDHKEPMFQSMFEKRLKGYRTLGYQMNDGTKKTEKTSVQMELF
jgi:superfamily II DNA or RNA helicase